MSFTIIYQLFTSSILHQYHCDINKVFREYIFSTSIILKDVKKQLLYEMKKLLKRLPDSAGRASLFIRCNKFKYLAKKPQCIIVVNKLFKYFGILFLKQGFVLSKVNHYTLVLMRLLFIFKVIFQRTHER